MKKILAVLTAISMVLLATPMVLGADDEIAGTFTPTGSSFTIVCNQTAPAFSTIALGESGEITGIAVNNTGNQNCSVVTTAEGAGTWALVAGTGSPTGTNQYCVNMDNSSGYVDAYTEKEVSADLSPAGNVDIKLKVFVGTVTDETTPAAQTFYCNLTAAALTP